MQIAESMYSRARVAGHPIHPMIVVFPIALFTVTVASLLAFVGTADAFYYRAALVACAGGVAMALIGALPGAIDLFSLPKGSRARSTGLKHASFALLTIGIFATAAALLYRNWVGGELEATIPLAVAVAGMVTLVIVGILGWTLVQTHHVGIKPEVQAARSVRAPELELGDGEDDDDFPGISAPHLYTEHVARH